MKFLEVILSRNKKKIMEGGVPSWDMVRNRAQPKITNIGTIYEIMKVAYQRYLRF